jgi:hypothetical protein
VGAPETAHGVRPDPRHRPVKRGPNHDPSLRGGSMNLNLNNVIGVVVLVILLLILLRIARVY